MSPKRPRKPAQPANLVKRLQAQQATTPPPQMQIITQEQAVLRVLGELQKRAQRIEDGMIRIEAMLAAALNVEAPAEEE